MKYILIIVIYLSSYLLLEYMDSAIQNCVKVNGKPGFVCGEKFKEEKIDVNIFVG